MVVKAEIMAEVMVLVAAMARSLKNTHYPTVAISHVTVAKVTQNQSLLYCSLIRNICAGPFEKNISNMEMILSIRIVSYVTFIMKHGLKLLVL